jgi:hypothetical protein
MYYCMPGVGYVVRVSMVYSRMTPDLQGHARSQLLPGSLFLTCLCSFLRSRLVYRSKYTDPVAL